MTNGEQAPTKSGLPIWAWVGIGCGALIVVVVIVLTIGGFLIANKAKDIAADFEEDPALATARMIVKLNPELEEVEADKEAGTMTIRNTKTGEVITVDLDDIQEGRLSFKSGDREVNIDASQLEESGSLKVTDEEGSVVFSTGDVSGEVPGWVPVYRGAEPTNRHSMTTETESMGGFELETGDGVDEVLEFYRAALDGGNFELSVNTFSQDESRGGMINGQHEDGRSITVLVNSEATGPTKVVINFRQQAP